MAESHMTPVDSGLGSIYSVALSTITQTSSVPPCAGEKPDNKESLDEVAAPSEKQSETKERVTTPEGHSCKGAESSKREMVTIETQTSPSSELCPVLPVKSADSESKEQCECPSPTSDGQQSQSSDKENETADSLVSPENNSKPGSDDEKSSTPQPVLPSQVAHDAHDMNDRGPDSVTKADTPKLSVGNDEHDKANKTPSPVLVTVSSEESDGDKTLTISESLR